MDVVDFLHAGIVVGEAVHDAGQIAVHGAEDIDSDREVGTPEQRLPLLAALALNLLRVGGHPARAARDDFHPGFEAALDVAVGNRGRGEFDGDIGGAEGFALEILLVVDVYSANDVVAAVESYLLNHMAHLAITY